MSNSAAWGLTRHVARRARAADARDQHESARRGAHRPADRRRSHVLFVYNCNPAATIPDQRRVLRGLERDDLFTVVFEQVLTDTAPYADVVLPATTFLEHYDFATRLRSDHDAA